MWIIKAALMPDGEPASDAPCARRSRGRDLAKKCECMEVEAVEVPVPVPGPVPVVTPGLIGPRLHLIGSLAAISPPLRRIAGRRRSGPPLCCAAPWLAWRRFWRLWRTWSTRTSLSDPAFALLPQERGLWPASLPLRPLLARPINPRPVRAAMGTTAGISTQIGVTAFATFEAWPTATTSAMRCRVATSSPPPQPTRAMRASSIKAAPRESEPLPMSGHLPVTTQST